MTREEVIGRLCVLVSSVWRTLDPGHVTASDCFCRDAVFGGVDYRNEGLALDFIEKAVKNAIESRKKENE